MIDMRRKQLHFALALRVACHPVDARILRRRNLVKRKKKNPASGNNAGFQIRRGALQVCRTCVCMTLGTGISSHGPVGHGSEKGWSGHPVSLHKVGFGSSQPSGSGC
jgi:hypothetical protein